MAFSQGLSKDGAGNSAVLISDLKRSAISGNKGQMRWSPGPRPGASESLFCLRRDHVTAVELRASRSQKILLITHDPQPI
jgi:hypothetical protein